jgi:hypothetical protein
MIENITDFHGCVWYKLVNLFKAPYCINHNFKYIINYIIKLFNIKMFVQNIIEGE